jgi:hypothetical protein
MNFNRRRFIGATIAASATAGASSVLFARSTPMPEPLAPVIPAAPKLAERPSLLQEALGALDRHGSRLARRDRIGLVDFSVHSSEHRFHLVDVESGRITHSWLVAHGKGSDPGHTGYLQEFSNRYGSNATSRGAYCMANPYYGKYGRSQRLLGLDPENDAALERAIVLHGANYVDESLIDAHGRIGRSYGCFSVKMDEVGQVMDMLGEGHMLYAGRTA